MKFLLGSGSARFTGIVGAVIATMGVAVLALPAIANADTCLGGGSDDDNAGGGKSKPKDAGPDASLGTKHKRNLGMGLLSAASLSTVWLSLRRPGRGKKEETDR